MFATPSIRLDEQVVRCFLTASSLTAEEIRRLVAPHSAGASLRAIYKSLGRLQLLGVLIKRGKSYSLRLTWLLNVFELSESLYRRVTADPLASGLIPGAGESLSWTFRSLARLDTFWVDLMLSLFLCAEGEAMHQYVPHAWFLLVHPSFELETVKALNRSGNRILTIIGSDSYLDRRNAAVWTEPAFRTSFAPSPFHELRGTYLNVISDFVLTIRIDDATSARIDELFTSVEKRSDLDAPAIVAALNKPCRATLRLEQNSRKAAKMLRKFEEYWGVTKKGSAPLRRRMS